MDANVALRKESVDRNPGADLVRNVQNVALRKESVDRNCYIAEMDEKDDLSLSARRAWIEITSCCLWRTRTRRRSPQGERG